MQWTFVVMLALWYDCEYKCLHLRWSVWFSWTKLHSELCACLCEGGTMSQQSKITDRLLESSWYGVVQCSGTSQVSYIVSMCKKTPFHFTALLLWTYMVTKGQVNRNNGREYQHKRMTWRCFFGNHVVINAKLPCKFISVS